jgi:hypothetical protein
MKTIRNRMANLFVLAALTMLAACAQLIVIAPDSTVSTKGQLIQHKVGLYISPADLALETRHPRGAGDTVTYLPYRDLETPIYAALRDSFLEVARIDDLADPVIKKDGLSLLFVPRIKTTSVSGVIGMWAPTDFSVTISGDFVSTATGAVLFSVSSTGTGTATASELLGQPHRAARRASSAAIQALRNELAEQAKRRPD